MDLDRVKYSLNQKVIHNAAEYIFIGCTLRLNDDGFYYEAILRDTRAHNSELVCLLRDIQEKQKRSTARNTAKPAPNAARASLI